MKYKVVLFIAVLILSVSTAAMAENGLATHYDFSQGSGAILADVSGNGNDGKIIGAKWEIANGRPTLRFAENCYVDCGNKLNMLGDTTILAWVKLISDSWPNVHTNAVIAENKGYGDNGFVMRVEGASSRMLYFANVKGSLAIANSNTPLINNECHQVALVKSGNKITWYLDGIFDGSTVVKDPPPTSDSFYISESGQSFQGLMNDFKVYKRALTASEIKQDFVENGSKFGKDTSWLGRIRMTPYYYFNQKKIVVSADLRGVAPLESGDTILVTISPADASSETAVNVITKEFTSVPDVSKDEYILDVSSISPGKKKLQIALKNGSTIKTSDSVLFDYSLPEVKIPSIQEKVVSNLPGQPAQIPFSINLSDGGGFVVKVGNDEFPVESSFSYPNGGENVFSMGKSAGEAGWNVKSKKINASTYKVVANGQFYSIDRKIRILQNRISVIDTITNKDSKPLGIILRNQVGFEARGIQSTYLGGNKANDTRDIKINPTVFLSKPGLGLGLIALDDVYIIQARGYANKINAGIFTDNFALDKGASYSVEWAIYPNGNGDYYDFINQVRKDENRNGVTAEGGFAFISVGVVPSKEYMDIRNMKYFSAPCLSNIIDDPTISLEGIEFIEYPKIRKQLKNQFDAARKIKPDLKFMFHIAHALYATNTPKEKFPDSMLVSPEGKQYDYYNNDGTYYNNSYFGKDRPAQGWKWWIFYPTLKNSFGKAMLDSVDMMVDEIGCNGAFMDGFMWTYGNDYTYNEWDKHSADIDAATKTIKRVKGSTLLLSQELLAAYVHKFNEKGGTVIANYPVFTRTLAKEKMVCDQECKIGPDIHLTHTPITLGRTGNKNEVDVYKDSLEALQTGNLYFYYNEGNLTYPTLPSFEFPLTYEEVHAGYIKGRERLVTMNPGVYGWANDRDMHYCYRFDARGELIETNFVTTVDNKGVRTQVDLKKDESAVIKKIPLSIRADSPLNAMCLKYDSNGLKLALNGKGNAKIYVRNGDFEIKPNNQYQINADKLRKIKSDAKGGLLFTVEMQGQTEITISPM